MNYLILFFLLLPNLYGFYAMWKDKNLAVQEKTRTPELDLFLIAIFFGAIGIYVGMFLFNHKIRKWYFQTAIPLLIIKQSLLIYYFNSFLSF